MTRSAIELATALIHNYESCVLHPYPDARGIATIGWGNTQYQDGTKVTLDDDELSQSEADALFVYWLQEFMDGVIHHATGAKPEQIAAFTSLAYNIGMAGFAASTALRQFLRGNYGAAGDAIEMWDKAGNHVLKGLQRRRRAERLVFDGATVTVAIAQGLAAFP